VKERRIATTGYRLRSRELANGSFRTDAASSGVETKANLLETTHLKMQGSKHLSKNDIGRKITLVFYKHFNIYFLACTITEKNIRSE
jgi:hypothetical protein